MSTILTPSFSISLTGRSSFPVSVESEFRQMEFSDTKKTDSRHLVHLGSERVPSYFLILFLVFILLFLLCSPNPLCVFFLLFPFSQTKPKVREPTVNGPFFQTNNFTLRFTSFRDLLFSDVSDLNHNSVGRVRTRSVESTPRSTLTSVEPRMSESVRQTPFWCILSLIGKGRSRRV